MDIQNHREIRQFLLTALLLLILTACGSRDSHSAKMVTDNDPGSQTEQHAKKAVFIFLLDRVDGKIIASFDNLLNKSVNGESALVNNLPEGYESITLQAFDLSNSLYAPVSVSFNADDIKPAPEQKAKDFLDSLRNDEQRNNHAQDRYIFRTLQNVTPWMNDPKQQYTLLYYSEGVENSGAEIGDSAENSGWKKGLFDFSGGAGGCNTTAIKEALRQMTDSTSWIITRLTRPARKDLAGMHVTFITVNKPATMNPGAGDCQQDIRELWNQVFPAMGLNTPQHVNSLEEGIKW